MKKMTTDNKYWEGKRSRCLIRHCESELKLWRKQNPECKVISVTRRLYKNYATLGVTFMDEDGREYWTNLFASRFV